MGEDTVTGDAGRGSLGPAGTKLQQKPKRLCLTGAYITEVRRPSRGEERNCGSGRPTRTAADLVCFAPLLLAESLPRKRFLSPTLLAGLHVEAVLLDFLNDVFLLHLALETPQSIFQGLTFLNDDFSHV
jgi:hypothetical protein